MIRILGVVFLLAVGGYCAFFTTNQEKSKLTVINAWIELLYEIRNQIDCFSVPLPQILMHADRALLEKLGAKNNCRDAKELLDASSPFLDKDTKKLLEDFAKEIGTTYRTEQVKRCDHYLTALESHRDKIKQTLPLRLKMLTTLHLCACLGAVILLW